MNFFEHIEAMHQEVRAFVEQEHPDFKVASVKSDNRTDYQPPMHGLAEDPMKLEWALTHVGAQFRVEAEQFSGLIRLTCAVLVDDTGKLHLYGRTITKFALR